MEFGAFVNFFGSKDRLVHISQLAANRVQKTTDVVKEGDKVKVKLLGFDDRGKVRLSMKVVDQATGEDLEAKQKAEREALRESAGEEHPSPIANAKGGRNGRPFVLSAANTTSGKAPCRSGRRPRRRRSAQPSTAKDSASPRRLRRSQSPSNARD